MLESSYYNHKVKKKNKSLICIHTLSFASAFPITQKVSQNTKSKHSYSLPHTECSQSSQLVTAVKPLPPLLYHPQGDLHMFYLLTAAGLI